MSSASAPSPPRARRLDLVYFGMAVVDIVMIVIALVVSHTTTTAFEAGVRTSATISARQEEVLRLTLLAQAIDGPPNDVFSSRDVEGERRKLHVARESFEALLAEIGEDYRTVRISPRDREVLAILTEAGEMGEEVHRYADVTFAHLERGRETAASAAMAQADHRFGELMGRLEVASALLEQIRAEHLDQQLRKTQAARQLEIWIAAAVCGIVILVCLYGAQLARTLREAGIERERMLAEVAAGRERMRGYADDVSHELRGPIAKMRLDLEVLLGLDRSPAEYQTGIENALIEAERLSRITESFLFIARAENAQSAPPLTQLDVAEELTTLARFYSATAEQAGVTLDVSGQGLVRADRTLFQRAVANLVSNALAHTPSGGRVRVIAGSDHAGTSIIVEDTGRGIEPALLEHVFDRFQRGRASSDGVGLGLAIVKTIMNLHHGGAEIASRVGEGTRVTLHFPDAAHTEARKITS